MNQLQEREEFAHYRKIKLLGEGSFGKAYLIERISDSLMCVMKIIDMGRMSENERKETLQEAKIIEHLKHPNIVKFIETFKTKKGKLCIVMDFADGGDLGQKIKEQGGKYMPENTILDLFTQICLGMKHVHDRKIIHRDLKGANVFLTKKGIVKIGDFGIAKVLSCTAQQARTMVGTPYYLSPEIVQSKPYNSKTDIWSMGVMLYELCALRPPFDAPSIHLLSMKIVRGVYNPIPSCFSSEIKTLIKQMLELRPDQRPDVNKILNTPLIQRRIKSYLTETVYKHEFSHTVLHKENVFNPKSNIQGLQNQADKNREERQKAEKAQEQLKQQRPPELEQRNMNFIPKPLVQQPSAAVLEQQRKENAAKFLANKIPKEEYQRKYGISPGMAGVLGMGGGYRPQTPNQGPQRIGASPMGAQPIQFPGDPNKPKPQAQGAGNLVRPPIPNYHFQQKEMEKQRQFGVPKLAPSAAPAVGGLQQKQNPISRPAVVGGDQQQLQIGGIKYQNAKDQIQKDQAAEQLEKLKKENEHKDLILADAKQKLEQERIEKEKIEKKLRERDDALKRKQELLEDLKKKENEVYEKKKYHQENLKMIEKAKKEAEEKQNLKQAAIEYKQQVLAQMKVFKKREEQENQQRQIQEEQRIRNQRQEEISRKIQEEHIRKKEEAEKLKQAEKEAESKLIREKMEKKRIQELELQEKKQQAELAKRKQMEKEIEEAKRKRREIHEKQKLEEQKKIQEFEQQQILKNKGEQKKQDAAQMNQPVPDSTLMRNIYGAKNLIDELDKKMNAKQQQINEQKNKVSEAPFVSKPQKIQEKIPQQNVAPSPQVLNNKPTKDEIAAKNKEIAKQKLEEERAQMKRDIQRKQWNNQQKKDCFLEINNKPFELNTPIREQQKVKYDHKNDDSHFEMKNKEFLIKPSTPSKNANKVLVSARQNSANKEKEEKPSVNQNKNQNTPNVLKKASFPPKSQRPATSNVKAVKQKVLKRPEWNYDLEEEKCLDGQHSNQPLQARKDENGQRQLSLSKQFQDNEHLPHVNQKPQKSDNQKLENRQISDKNLPQIGAALVVQKMVMNPSKSPKSEIKNYKGAEAKDDAEDLFDMTKGNFDAYDDSDDDSSFQNNEIYQVYGELLQVVQNHYNGVENVTQSEFDSNSPTTARQTEQSQTPSNNGDKKIERTAWNKKKHDSKSPQNDKNQSPSSKILMDSSEDASEDDIQRNPGASPIILSKKKNQFQSGFENQNRFQPKMTAVIEETEPESSFKETNKHQIKKGIQKNKKNGMQNQELPPDREDDFSDQDDAEKKEYNLNSFTIHPGKQNKDHEHTFIQKEENQVDFSKLESVEKILEYFENELGKQKFAKVHPIISSFGDDILFQEKIPELKDQLKNLLTSEQVEKYHQTFATLVFYELQMEKEKPAEKQFNPKGMMNVVNCFKDGKATATFGKFGSGLRQ